MVCITQEIRSAFQKLIGGTLAEGEGGVVVGTVGEDNGQG